MQQLRRRSSAALLLGLLLVAAAAGAARATPLFWQKQGDGGGSDQKKSGDAQWQFPTRWVPSAGLRLPTAEDFFGAPENVTPVPPNGYRGTYRHVTCLTDAIVRPANTEELADAVRSLGARARAEGRPLKMRAARDGFATMPSFPCAAAPEGRGGGKCGEPAPLVAALLLNKVCGPFGRF